MTHKLRAAIVAGILVASAVPTLAADFRPPAVPLVTIDPYTSCWSFADHLGSDWPRHWTGNVHAMSGLLRVDGKPWRFMGLAEEVGQQAEQLSLEVRPTQTVYRFAAGGVHLTVTFTAPLLLDDLDLTSRPANYVTFAAVSADGRPHSVQVYFDVTGEWVVNRPSQPVAWQRVRCRGARHTTHRQRRTAGARHQGGQRPYRLGLSLPGSAPRHCTRRASPKPRSRGPRLPPIPRRRQLTKPVRARPKTAGRRCRLCSTWEWSRPKPCDGT